MPNILIRRLNLMSKDILQDSAIWQSVIKNTRYIIMIVDREGTILFINHTVPGINKEEVPGKKLNEYIDPQYHPLMNKALETVFCKGESSRYVVQGWGPHGFSWYESVASPIQNQEKIVAASIITHDITQQKKAEEALSESERKFRILAERSIDGIFALNDEGYYTFVSPAVRRIAGYEPCEVLGRFFLDFIYPDDLPVAAAAFDSLTQKGIIEGLELRIKKKDGSLGYVEINASPIMRKDGSQGIQGIVRDISFRRKNEELLWNQNEVMTAILNVANESIFLFDTQNKIISVNTTAAQRVGKSPQDLIGADARIFFSDDVLKRRLKIVNKAIQTGKPQRLQDKRGDYWFDARIYPIKDKGGKVDKLVVFARDITKEKQHQLLLQKSEQKYRAIFNYSPEGIALLDTQGNIIDINGRLGDWLGYRSEEVIGKHLSDQPFFSIKTKELLMKRFHQRMKKKNIPPYEVEIIAQDGHVVTGMLQGTILYGPKGDIMGDLVMISNITKRKILEKKVFEQEKMAALGRIAAVVSHELNTPLANISLAVEMLSSQRALKGKEEINTIKSEVALASDIISRVLDFSRTDDLQYSPMDLGNIVREAVKTLQGQYELGKVTFHIPQSLTLPLQGDKHRLREVFINILKNALEAADPHTDTHHIYIQGKTTDHSTVVSIRDTGTGIEKHLQEKITDAFFTTKPLAEGTGLGLSIAQWIIRQHEGELLITSKKNIGTTVTITLPQRL